MLKCGSYDTDGLRCEGNYEHGGAHWNASSMWVTFEIPAPAPECGFCALSGCAFCDLPSATKVPEGGG